MFDRKRLTKRQLEAVEFFESQSRPVPSKAVPFAPITLRSLVKRGVVGRSEDGRYAISPDWVNGPGAKVPLLPENFAIVAVRQARTAQEKQDKSGAPAWYGPVKEKTTTLDMTGWQPVHHVVRHSPDGFEWGYGGSGPADLALSVLTLVLGPGLADHLYQRFKADVVARKPQSLSVVFFRVKDIMAWFDAITDHDWRQRAITRGRNRGEKLPMRCRKCGKIQRPDGRNGYCLAF